MMNDFFQDCECLLVAPRPVLGRYNRPPGNESEVLAHTCENWRRMSSAWACFCENEYPLLGTLIQYCINEKYLVRSLFDVLVLHKEVISEASDSKISTDEWRTVHFWSVRAKTAVFIDFPYFSGTLYSFHVSVWARIRPKKVLYSYLYLVLTLITIR